ncbi:MAG TPA: outer membrane protein [Pseudolabrys sp.]|jgi:outer membrane immunogenic protein
MLKRTALAAVIVSVVTHASAASAADLPRKAPAYTPPPPPVLIWNGFYAGLNLGYGWANVDATGFNDQNLGGIIGGGQIGYNWQFHPNWVLGIEGDFQGSAQRRSDDFVALGVPFTVDQRIPWFATARARLGYAQGPWLVYVTGGAAWLNYELEVSTPGASVSDDASKLAWTVGGGVEWMFMPKWSAKLEYLFIDTDDRTVTLLGNTFTARARDNVVRAGVNYHF